MQIVHYFVFYKKTLSQWENNVNIIKKYSKTKHEKLKDKIEKVKDKLKNS